MSEESIVAIIVALLGTGGLGSWLSLRRPKRRTQTEPRLTPGDAQAAEAHVSQAVSIALLEELRRQLAQEREIRERDVKAERQRGERLEGAVEELRLARREDSRQISTLRGAVQLLMTWAQDIHTRWHVIRLQDSPPDLPEIDIN